jgi:bla regulator protein BlaR1
MNEHLVQTTLFAIAIFLITLFFRNNAAKVRHLLWLTASVKFLIPFSLLMAVGSQIPWRIDSTPRAATAILRLGNSSEKLIHNPKEPQRVPPVRPLPVGVLLWVVGSIAVLTIRIIRVRRVAAMVRDAEPFQHGGELDIRITTGTLEPGVFGILRPVLMLPAGIFSSLSEPQLESLFAHELCHIRRRDNLTAAIHAVVEILFWFHPLAWWIGRQLVIERERACDEAVVLSGADPQTYAQGILNVCKLYLQAPAVCMQGVTGADLAQRMKEIMNPCLPSKLTPAKKLLLACIGLTALVGPVALGLIEAPAIRAQEQPSHFAFEVASVKPNTSGDQRSIRVENLPSGRFVMQGLPLLIIASYAYDIPFQSPRLAGGAEWQKARGEVYDIEATAPKDAFSPGMTQKNRDARVRLMLQSLLAERFKMKVRIDPKEQPVYGLVVGPSGPKLKAAKVEEKDCDASSNCHQMQGGQGRGIHGSAISIDDVTLFVQNFSDKPVVNKTGLTGLYDIQTEGWQPMRPKPPMGPDGTTPTGGDAGLYDPDRQTLFDVFRQLGLKMEPQRAVIDMYVVDHVEKPSAN